MMMLRRTGLTMMSRFCGPSAPLMAPKSINNVTLVGVIHDIQSGYVFEDAVTQFTLTTTSIDTTNPVQECVVEKDHHTIRCYGDVFSAEIKSKIKEGNVVCVNGRLRLNPQLEAGTSKHYYFPFVHVQPPHGQVAIVHTDRRKAPAPVSPVSEAINNGAATSASPPSDAATSAPSGAQIDSEPSSSQEPPASPTAGAA